MTFSPSPQEQDRIWETAILSVWKYKIHCYIFCVCALWNKPNTDSRAERVKEKLIRFNLSPSAASLAPPIWYPLLCWVPQRKGTKKVIWYGLLFWYHSQLLTVETEIIAYRTVLYRTAQWKQAISVQIQVHLNKLECRGKVHLFQ